ncbi:fibroblast growth factor 6 isoform X1 [Tamandua tetradactyla]|uniref:fibroblast growth factor 6 isoform X1 n=1 Tax=Tamandua tetradactyla TaxID=48850 RepID=UPI004054163A
MALGQRLLITMSRGAGRLQGTLWALVFLGVLAGTVVPSPAGTRANSTLLDSRGWGTLLSRSRTGLAGDFAGVNWESGYLVGIKRQRRLYCNVGIGFHLQVPPDGRISGTHEENPYSLLEISTVERGVVSLFGVKSGLFVAMNSKGRLYTTILPARAFAMKGELKLQKALVRRKPAVGIRLSSSLAIRFDFLNWKAQRRPACPSARVCVHPCRTHGRDPRGESAVGR